MTSERKSSPGRMKNLKSQFLGEKNLNDSVTERGHADGGVAASVGVVDHGVETLVKPLPENNLSKGEKVAELASFMHGLNQV